MAEHIQPDRSTTTGGTLDETIEALTAFAEPSVRRAPRRSDQFADTMSVIGAALEHPQVDPSEPTEPLLAAVDATAAASSWMHWRVRLRGNWRAMVPGPMLVETDGTPAAVVPSRTGTLLVRGPDRQTRRLDRNAAGGVSADAVAFAIDLPATAHWWSLVLWSLRRQRHDVWLYLALAVTSGLGALLLPATTSAVFNLAIPQGRTDLVTVLLAVFASASAAVAVVSLLRGYLLVRIRDRMDLVLSHAVTARLLRLKAAFFRSRPVGEVVSRATADQQARQSVDDAVVSLLISSVFGLSSIGFVFAAGASVGIVVALTVILVLAGSVAVNWKKRTVLPALLERRSSTDAMLLSILRTLGTWRVTAREDRALVQWAQLQGEHPGDGTPAAVSVPECTDHQRRVHGGADHLRGGRGDSAGGCTRTRIGNCARCFPSDLHGTLTSHRGDAGAEFQPDHAVGVRSTAFPAEPHCRRRRREPTGRRASRTADRSPVDARSHVRLPHGQASALREPVPRCATR